MTIFSFLLIRIRIISQHSLCGTKSPYGLIASLPPLPPSLHSSPSKMNEQKDPRLHELATVFPSIDAAVVAEVWQARQAEGGEGWVERVTEDLLTLSDPSYKPEPRQVHTVDPVSLPSSFSASSLTNGEGAGNPIRTRRRIRKIPLDERPPGTTPLRSAP